MKSNKILTTLIATILIVSTVTIPTNAAEVSHDLSYSNLNLVEEELQYRNIIQEVSFSDTGSELVVLPKVIGEKYIPENAVLSEISVSDTVIYIQYSMDNILYTLAYHQDGKIEKHTHEENTGIIRSIDNRSSNVLIDNVRTNRFSETIPDEIVNKRLFELKEMSLNSEVLESEVSMSAIGNKMVYPTRPSSQDYKAKLVAWGTTYITSLSANRGYRTYETMHYYTINSQRGKSFTVGKSLASIASAMRVLPSTLKGWLSIAGVLLDASDAIRSACTVIDELSYTYLGGKETYIYDSTRSRNYVEVYSKWGNGKLSLGWTYSGAYRNPKWTHTSRSAGLTISNTSMLNEAKRVYNNNINGYGVWKWGVGNGKGY